jgi:ABC superfamily ATP binding cassette transporter permease subunit|nr:hypothetical protein [uncultured Stomatobaculum sp.]
MNKNRLFVLISSGVAILGSLLPWATVSAGIFGSMSVSGTEGDGTFIIILAIVAIVLSCLKDYKTVLPKNFATAVFVIGAVQSVIMLLNLINMGRMLGSQGSELKAYGVSVHIGFGFILVLLAAIATAVFGAMALSGGKLSKDTLNEVMDASKNLSKTVAQATTTAVKSASEEINKQSEKMKEAKEAKAASEAAATAANTAETAANETVDTATAAPENVETVVAEAAPESVASESETSDNTENKDDTTV